MEEAAAVTLLGLGLVFRSAQKVYELTPLRELRRRAAKGDERSHAIYQAARFESSLSYLLETLIALCVSGLSYLAFTNLKTTWAILVIGILILYIFAIKPPHKPGSLSYWLAAMLAPIFAIILKYLSPIIHVLTPRDFGKPKVPKFYDVDDLTKFLNMQKRVDESHIPGVDIDRAVAALEHRDIYVKDEMTPKKIMKVLSIEDPVGPVLLHELYESGQDCFAVREEGNEKFIGTVSLEQLTEAKEGGVVGDFVNKKVVYVNEDWLISEAVSAYQATSQTIYLVTNRKQKATGIISFARLLEKLVGRADKSKGPKYFNIDNVAAN